MSTLKWNAEYSQRIESENTSLSNKIIAALVLLDRVTMGNDAYISAGWDETKREAARSENRLAAELVAILAPRKAPR